MYSLSCHPAAAHETIIHNPRAHSSSAPLRNTVITQHFHKFCEKAFKMQAQRAACMWFAFVFELSISNYVCVCVYALCILLSENFFENVFFATFGPMKIARRPRWSVRVVFAKQRSNLRPQQQHMCKHSHTHTLVCACTSHMRMDATVLYEEKKTLICVQVNYQAAARCCCLYANMVASKYEPF